MKVRNEDIGEVIAITPAAMPFIPRINPDNNLPEMSWNAIEVTLRSIEEDTIVVQSGEHLWRVALSTLCSYMPVDKLAVLTPAPHPSILRPGSH